MKTKTDKRQKALKTAQSALGIIIVFAVIAAAFLFREQIENYAVTGYFGVFVASFASTATILLPAPGIVVVVQYAAILNPVFVVILGGVGTALGDMLGYYLGKNGTELTNFKADGKLFNWFKKIPYKLVFLFSFIPMPIFDIVGIFSGAAKLKPLKFFVFCVCGKLLKMTFYVLFFDIVKQFLPTLPIL